MTLRELIQEIIKLDEFENLASNIIDIHPDWGKSKKYDQVLKTYTRVAKEIEDLPGDDELEEHVIVIEKLEDTPFNKTDSWIDVHLCDMDGDKWSLDMTDWNGLVDLKIIDRTCETLTERLAHILYEMTFWGTTRAAVLHEAAQLELISKDKSNIIEVSMEEFLAETEDLK